MQEHIYKQLSEIEDEHWWHQSRLKLVDLYLEKMNLSPASRILDVGCGSGGTTRFLKKYGEVTGLDHSQTALDFAKGKAPKINFIKGDANSLSEHLEPSSFDLITFFNVLYHQWIKSEENVLEEVFKLLRPGGFVLLTEPAYKFLMRKHDVLDMGRTRYRIQDFKKYFRATHLDYFGGQYFNAWSFPICLGMAWYDAIVKKKYEDKSENTEELAIGSKFINATIKKYMDVENLIMRAIPIPMGVSLLVVGRKPVTD